MTLQQAIDDAIAEMERNPPPPLTPHQRHVIAAAFAGYLIEPPRPGAAAEPAARSA